MSSVKQSAAKIVRILQDAGFEAYFAGGCVRDILLGRTPKDYDIATSATPESVEKTLKRTKAIGKAFGVIQAKMDGHTFEIATFRTDHEYHDGRRPSAVTFASAREDALRRDFTVNSMFYDPVSEAYLDYAGGMPDIGAKVIRAVGDPDIRFKEDHLRMLRCVRLAQVLGFRIDTKTSLSVRRNARLIRRVSIERIRDELLRTLTEAPRPGNAMLALNKLGIFGQILPQTHMSHSLRQLRRTSLMLDNLVGEPLEVLLTALFRRTGSDAGIAAQRSRVDVIASKTALELNELRIPKSLARSVLRAQRIFWHLSRARKHCPRELLPDLVSDEAPGVIRILAVSFPDRARSLAELRKTVKSRLRKKPVTGNDLKKMGISPGPEMASLLAEALILQCEGIGRKEVLRRITRS